MGSSKESHEFQILQLVGILDVVLKVGTNTLSQIQNIYMCGKNILQAFFFCLSVMNIFATFMARS
jgi:hypothetical protein